MSVIYWVNLRCSTFLSCFVGEIWRGLKFLLRKSFSESFAKKISKPWKTSQSMPKEKISKIFLRRLHEITKTESIDYRTLGAAHAAGNQSSRQRGLIGEEFIRILRLLSLSSLTEPQRREELIRVLRGICSSPRQRLECCSNISAGLKLPCYLWYGSPLMILNAR